MSTKNFVSYGDAETLFTGVGNEITDLKDWTDADAKSVTGNPITISDAAAVKAKALSMTIEPVQDLHGQSVPYVGGAGKNKLPLVLAKLKADNTDGTWTGNVYKYRGIDYTIDVDDGGNVVSIDANGIATDDWATIALKNIPIAQAGYIVNGITGSSNTGLRFDVSVRGGSYITVFNDAVSLNVASDTTYDFLITVRTSGVEVSHVKLYPMIRLSTESDATFAPYTNYCPITGHTEASVQRDGVNRFDKNSPNIENKLFLNDGRVVGSNSWRASDFIKIDVNKGYTLSGITTHPNTYTDNIRLFNEFKEDIGYSAVGVNSYPKTFPSGTKYIKFCCRDTEIGNAQFQEGAATPYVPYAGKTYTIALGDTIYGGSVDFDSGVMTVDRVCVEYDGTQAVQNVQRIDNVVRGQFVIQNSVSYPPAISNYLKWVNDWSLDQPHFYIYDNKINVFLPIPNDGISTWDSYLTSNPLQVCYELATPFTVQLTPTQIQLLKGTNTLTANGSSISLTYQQDNLLGEVMEQVDAITPKQKRISISSDNIGVNEYERISISFSDLPSDTNIIGTYVLQTGQTNVVTLGQLMKTSNQWIIYAYNAYESAVAFSYDIIVTYI